MDGELFVKMDDVVSHSDIIDYLKAAERITNILYSTGFDAKDVHDYLHQLVINDL
jgi:hypothetical protein